jgi:hypothetical protein
MGLGAGLLFHVRPKDILLLSTSQSRNKLVGSSLAGFLLCQSYAARSC